MQKIKTVIGVIVFFVVGFLVTVPAKASNVSITQLPGYINYTDFKLSCSALGGTTAQFSSRKDGEGYSNFGPLINLTTTPCQVQVTGTQFGSESKFWFKVTLDDGNFAEVSTTLDTTGLGTVSDFGKDRSAGNTIYNLHWKNPNDSDYQKVFIYRGTEGGFEADSSHKIAEAGGNPGDTMTWDDAGLDPTKEYYYYIRAIDRAGNSSSLVGDVGTTTVTSTPKPGTAGTGGVVTQLPSEGGSILGTETQETVAPTGTAASTSVDINSIQKVGLLKWILTHKKISLGILLVLAAAYYFISRRQKQS